MGFKKKNAYSLKRTLPPYLSQNVTFSHLLLGRVLHLSVKTDDFKSIAGRKKLKDKKLKNRRKKKKININERIVLMKRL